jgi:ribonuclease HI
VETARASADEAVTSEKSIVWTDGSCNVKGIRGRGGWAALLEEGGTVREISGGVDATTHNRMELTAICEALEMLSGAIEVRTDSTYVEKCFNQNWHERWLRDGSWKGSSGRIKNRDLWERLFGLVWDDHSGREIRLDQGSRGGPQQHPRRPSRASGCTISRRVTADQRDRHSYSHPLRATSKYRARSVQ